MLLPKPVFPLIFVRWLPAARSPFPALSMLTLDNFDQQLSRDLLKEAEPYYRNGSVLYIDQDEVGTCHAEVDGSDMYSVEITLNGRTVADFFCDCPVESGTCKHVVAVLFSLREELKKGQNNRKRVNQRRVNHRKN